MNFVEQFADLRADYAAAKTGRFRRRRSGLPAMGGPADYHVRNETEFLRILEYARDMDRNDVVVGQIVDRAVQNTIQDGIGLDPQTGDAEVDRELMGRWRSWSEDPTNCDVAGEWCWWDFERFALRQSFVDGDVIVLGLDEGPVQMIEAHRVRTPSGTKRNVVNGVLLNERRKRMEYWITREDVDPMRAISRVSDIIPYPVRDENGDRVLFHPYNPKRSTQTRGVSAFAPIFDLIGMHDDVQFAKLVQAQIVSCFAIIYSREQEFSQAGQMAATGTRTTETLASGTTRTLEGVSPGMVVDGPPGVKVSGFTPDVPNPEFFPHVKLILQLIGVNLGMPLVLALLDASETNFSGWRGAVDQARLGFRWNQRWLVERLHRPVYLWKVRQWLAEYPELRTAASRLSAAGGDIFGHRWNPPRWRYIEPKTDAEADDIRVSKRLISPRRLYAESGIGDHDEFIAEYLDDHAKLIEEAVVRAERINIKAPWARVDWREIARFDPNGRAPEPSKAEPTEEQAVTDFQRKVWLEFQKDGTVADMQANLTRISELGRKAGVPINEEYDEPYIPVVSDAGPVVTGETTEDSEGDIVGGVAESSSSPTEPGQGEPPKPEMESEMTDAPAEKPEDAEADEPNDDGEPEPETENE